MRHAPLQPALLAIVISLFTQCTTDKGAYRSEKIYLGSRIPSYKLDISRTKTRASGALSDALVLETLEERKDLLEYCYEDSLLQDKALQGQAAWRLTTNKKGIVTEFKPVADETTITNDFLLKCVSHQLLRTKFPASIKGESEITVHLLFAILKS